MTTTAVVRLVGADAEGDLVVRRDPPDRSRLRPYWILYLHGFGSSQAGDKAGYFRERAWAAGVEFVSVDFQGHGESGGGMRGLTVERLLRDVERVRGWREEIDDAPVGILGSSLGGLTGLWEAALRPEGILGGAHIAPAVNLRESIQASLGPAGIDRWREEGVTTVEHELGTWHIGWGFFESLERHPAGRLATELARPARLYQGRHDDTVSWRAVADLAAASPALEMVLFDDGDHRLLDRRSEIWEGSLEWFDDLDSVRRREFATR